MSRMSRMSSSLEPYAPGEINFDTIEEFILELADKFDIKVEWDQDTTLLTVAFAIVGFLVGSRAGGSMGAALGAGIGGAGIGYAVATTAPLREIWETVKKELQELIFIVSKYLRKLDPVHVQCAFRTLLICTSSQHELVSLIVDFIGRKLGRKVSCSIKQA